MFGRMDKGIQAIHHALFTTSLHCLLLQLLATRSEISVSIFVVVEFNTVRQVEFCIARISADLQSACREGQTAVLIFSSPPLASPAARMQVMPRCGAAGFEFGVHSNEKIRIEVFVFELSISNARPRFASKQKVKKHREFQVISRLTSTRSS